MRVERNGAGVDRLAAGRLLAQFGDVHVAEISQHQRARDRRGGEHQHVDRFALLRQRQPLVHAEAVLLVDDGEREIVKRHFFLEQRVGADQQIDVAERQPVENALALAAALAPGQDRHAQAGGFRQRRDSGEMLAGEDFGRRHEGGLPPGFDDGGRRDQRHHGLAGADIALQQPQHALRAGEVGDDVVDRLLLRMGERIGQAFEDARAQAAFAGRAAAGLPAHMRAHQRERELAGQQFVIGEPRPRQALRQNVVRLGRPVQMAQRGGEGGKALARDPGLVLPFGQIRQPRQRVVHRPPHIAGGQPLGQRIDRLDQRQRGEALLVHHAVGMHHLQHAVVEFGGAGDVARLAHRQQLLQVVAARVEIGQRDVAGVVVGVDAIGRARAMRRRRPVIVHRHRHGDHLAGLHVAQFGARAAVDGARRQMKQEIDHARRLALEQPGIVLFQLRPDAGQAGERGEQGVEHERAHGADHCRISAVMAGLVPAIHALLFAAATE